MVVLVCVWFRFWMVCTVEFCLLLVLLFVRIRVRRCLLSIWIYCLFWNWLCGVGDVCFCNVLYFWFARFPCLFVYRGCWLFPLFLVVVWFCLCCFNNCFAFMLLRFILLVVFNYVLWFKVVYFAYFGLVGLIVGYGLIFYLQLLWMILVWVLLILVFRLIYFVVL